MTVHSIRPHPGDLNDQPYLQARLLDHAISCHPTRLSVDELIRGTVDDIHKHHPDHYEVALRALVQAGALHRMDDYHLWPSQTAVYIAGLPDA